ncbi:hypothetical protein Tco_1058564 [Tanacetum coccineum]|uniref:Uncharacterized protein n=1 Tax=Tanacetum coccineum TaxID=301880 RepID=A0ABQ5HAD3_9ASTR
MFVVMRLTGLYCLLNGDMACRGGSKRGVGRFCPAVMRDSQPWENYDFGIEEMFTTPYGGESLGIDKRLELLVEAYGRDGDGGFAPLGFFAFLNCKYVS